MAIPLESPRFDVSINGEHRCVAGFDGQAVLGVNVTHVQIAGLDAEPARALTGTASAAVRGLQGRNHVVWMTDELLVGDNLTIRVREGGPIDPTIPGELSKDDMQCRFANRMERRPDKTLPVPHRFRVTVNGNQLCTAGVESGVLSVSADWVRRDPNQCPPHERDSIESWQCPHCTLLVTGMENEIHLRWSAGELETGDEVVIDILGPGAIDPPQHRNEHRLILHGEHEVMGGPRVTLRRLIEEDLDFLTTMLGDAEVMRYWPQPLDREGAEEWLRHQQQRYADDDCGYWLVVDSKTHEPVGQAGVLMIDVEGERLPCLGYMIHQPFQRKGYGVEAAWMCINWIDFHNHPRAYSLVRPENEPSMGLVRKLGMKPTDTVQFKGFQHVRFELELNRP